MSHGYSKGISIDTDGSLSTNSDLLVPSQKAVKTYVNTLAAGIISIQSALADDTSLNAAVYPIWAAASGNQALKISTTKIYFNPSTGTLTTTALSVGQIYATQVNASGGMLTGYAAGTAGTVDGISKDGLAVLGHNGSQAGDLLFRTTPLSAKDIIFAVEGAEAMRLSSTKVLTVFTLNASGQIQNTTPRTDINNANNVTISDATAQAANVGGGISFRGKYTDAGAYTEFAGIHAYKDNATTGNFGAGLAFYTRANGTGGWTVLGAGGPASAGFAMVLTSAGKLGIGLAPDETITLAGKQHFLGAGHAVYALPSSGYVTYLDLAAGATGFGSNGAGIRLDSAGAGADGTITFSTNQSGVGQATRMTIANTGAVSIPGTTTFGGNVYVPGQLAPSSSTLGQYSAYVCLRGSAQSQFEFGHSNTGGYGSTIGAENSSGNPYIAFQAGKGTNNNTYKTYGLKGMVLKTDTSGNLYFGTLATASADNQTIAARMIVFADGNVTIGDNAAALATNATAGFLYIPTCAGVPTGVPTAVTGAKAIVYDTTNNNFYLYNGAWKKVGMA